MGYVYILTKGITSIVVLFLVTKLMGRKQVGQLNLFDYIIGITIGSIAATMTIDEQVDFFEGTFAIFVYGAVALTISLLTTKSIVARRLITGSPCVLMERGKILMKSLKASKIDINDLLEEARNNGYFDLSQVEYAIMEANGRISFLLKSKYCPTTLDDMKIKADYKGLCANLVIDGKIMKKDLKRIDKDEKWLLTRLKNLGHEDLSNLLLVICDSKEKLTVFEKNLELKEPKILE